MAAAPPRPRGKLILGTCLAGLVLFTAFVSVSRASDPQNSVLVESSSPSVTTKAFGSCPSEVQTPLKWRSDRSTGNHICCHNERWAEQGGYWESTTFLSTEDGKHEVTFYDSVTGLPLFIAPRGRSWDEFVSESKAHMWPSFRDAEVVTQNVIQRPGGEMVSVNGTHLGHNLPDATGNRYCINIVCVAGVPAVTGRRRAKLT